MKKTIAFLAIIGLSSVAMDDSYKTFASCHGSKCETKALGKSKAIAKMSKA